MIWFGFFCLLFVTCECRLYLFAKEYEVQKLGSANPYIIVNQQKLHLNKALQTKTEFSGTCRTVYLLSPIQSFEKLRGEAYRTMIKYCNSHP
ncbi:hypothetical protein SprV_0401623300 [Sparganum proliferum]